MHCTTAARWSRQASFITRSIATTTFIATACSTYRSEFPDSQATATSTESPGSAEPITAVTGAAKAISSNSNSTRTAKSTTSHSYSTRSGKSTNSKTNSTRSSRATLPIPMPPALTS